MGTSEAQLDQEPLAAPQFYSRQNLRKGSDGGFGRKPAVNMVPVLDSRGPEKHWSHVRTTCVEEEKTCDHFQAQVQIVANSTSPWRSYSTHAALASR